jgi:hypothetical protein
VNQDSVSRPHAYFDTSAVNWLLNNKGNDLAFVQRLKRRFLPVVNKYVVVELGATPEADTRRKCTVSHCFDRLVSD